MKGIYTIKLNGQIVAQQSNIITASGIDAINYFLAKSIPDWAGTIAVGALYTTSASTDTILAYETDRFPVTLKSYNVSTKQITAKGSLNPIFVGQIYEMGIFPQNVINADAAIDNLYISNFSDAYGSSASSLWQSGPNTGTLNYAEMSPTSRVGASSTVVNAASVLVLYPAAVNVSSFGTSDYLDLLYNIPAGTVGTTTPSLTFILTDTQGYTWRSQTNTLDTASQRWLSASFAMSNLPQTGFNYNISTITASFQSGTASVIMDALRLRNGKTRAIESCLVSRTSSSAALVTTKYGQPLEIEYSLTVT